MVSRVFPPCCSTLTSKDHPIPHSHIMSVVRAKLLQRHRRYQSMEKDQRGHRRALSSIRSSGGDGRCEIDGYGTARGRLASDAVARSNAGSVGAGLKPRYFALSCSLYRTLYILEVRQKLDGNIKRAKLWIQNIWCDGHSDASRNLWRARPCLPAGPNMKSASHRYPTVSIGVNWCIVAAHVMQQSTSMSNRQTDLFRSHEAAFASTCKHAQNTRVCTHVHLASHDGSARMAIGDRVCVCLCVCDTRHIIQYNSSFIARHPVLHVSLIWNYTYPVVTGDRYPPSHEPREKKRREGE